MQTTAINFKELKLALTVKLMNLQKRKNMLDAVRELMLQFKEVGAFLGLAVTERSRLDHRRIKRIYAIQFEQCQLDIELISDSQTQHQVINTFYLS